MLFASRIRLKPLAALCRRLAITTKAGLEDRKIWADEAARGNAVQQRHLAQIRDRLAQGDSVSSALETTGDYFPKLMRQMIQVGDISGNLDRTYARLADHYERTLAVRREFRGRLTWPLFQLGMAILIVGLLIFIMGLLPQKAGGGPIIDLLGLGLYGIPGLIVYANLLIAVALLGIVVWESGRRGALWARPIQVAALRIPVVGGALQTLCLARVTWAMQLVFDSSMDLRVAIPLALDAAGNHHFSQLGRRIAERIEEGATLHQAFAETEVFPDDFLDALHVGETTGMLAETMQRQAAQYHERSAAALSLLAQLLGYVVWASVAVVLVLLIFRIFTVAYLEPMREFL
jgi:type IV pilus assembly protein PilC